MPTQSLLNGTGTGERMKIEFDLRAVLGYFPTPFQRRKRIP